ncbi:MAG: transaldolase, partial [Frankiaceae bacterium]|nr:transaldolase [Frankiaceae bacterium]
VDLVAPGTVNTMPEATLDAVADHGVITGPTANTGYDAARAVIEDLGRIGVSYDEVVDVIEREGVKKFEDSWGQLIDGVTRELERFGAQVGSGTTPAGGGQPAAAK